MKSKTNGQPQTKKKRKEQFSRISSTLLPNAALATAVPQSPRQINLSRSPSPLARAIASFTKVGQAIIGDTSPHRKESTNRKKKKNSTQEASTSGIHARGRSTLKRSMANRPPMPLPAEHIEEEPQMVEDTYAKVNKTPKKTKPAQYSVSERTISDDEITSVSEIDENNVVTKHTRPRSKETIHVPHHAEMSPHHDNIPSFNESLEDYSVNEFQMQSIHENRDFTEERIFVEEENIIPIEEIQVHAVDPFFEDQLIEENVTSHGQLLEDRSISEGQILTIPNKSPEQISDAQKIYLSNERLDCDYILYEGENFQDSKQISSLMMQNASLNSSLSASNFISAEKLINKLEKCKSDNIQTSALTVPAQMTQYRKEKGKVYEKDKVPVKKQNLQISSSNDSLNVTCIEGVPTQRNLRTPSENGRISRENISIHGSESQLPEDYLHMSPRRSLQSSSDHLKTKRRQSSNSRLSNCSPVSRQESNTAQPSETRIRKSLNRQLIDTIDILLTLSNTVSSPALKQVAQQRINLLQAIAQENKQSIRNPHHPEKNISSRSSSNVLLHQPQPDLLTQQVLLLDADRKVLQNSNRSLIEENNTLRKMNSTFKEEELKLENETLTKRAKILKDKNKNKTLLESFQNEHQTNYPDYLRSFTLFGQPPPEKVNDANLLQLLYTYDEKLKEKTQLIKSYEERLSYFELHPKETKKRQMDKSDLSVSMDEWMQLKAQSKLVLEENQLLMEQKILYKKTIDDLTKEYQTEVTSLSLETIKHTQEKKRYENLLSDGQFEISQLRNKNDKLIQIIDEQIDSEEHDTKIEKINRDHRNEVNLFQNERDDLKSMLEAVSREKDNLAIQVTDLTALTSRLRLEIELTEKNFRKSEKRLVHCLKQLESVSGKEITIKETLAYVIKVAERNARERDKLLKVVASEKDKTQTIIEQLENDDIKLNKLHNKFKKQKDRNKEKVADINLRLRHQDNEMASLKDGYEKELDVLKDMVRQKQKFINRIQTNKKSTEAQMEEMLDTLCDKNRRSSMVQNSTVC